MTTPFTIIFVFPPIQGNMIDSGSTYFGVNIPGFVLHSAVHSARPDAKCVVHIHHPACIAVNRAQLTAMIPHKSGSSCR